MLSPIKWYGGKYYLRKHILNIINHYFDNHDEYIEPFAGGISILLAKEKCQREIINDLDIDLINFYINLRDNYYDLMEVIDEFNYDRESFEQSKNWEWKKGIERSGYWFVNNRLSFSGHGETFSRRFNNFSNEGKTSFINILNQMKVINKRLSDIQIYNKSYEEVIGGKGLIYFDPPYLKSSRLTKEDVYNYEMDYDQHERMLSLILKGEYGAIISHYNHPLYLDKLKDLICIRADVHNRTTNKSNSTVTEYLWIKAN